MKQAEYTPKVIGHFALAEENYCHFTSPIRRYPDLTIHRIFDRIVTQSKASHSPIGKTLLQLGTHCSTTERRAERAERELTKLKLLSFFEDKVGMELEATITGVDRYGFFVRGDQLPVEGLVHISTLTDADSLQFERDRHALVGRHSGLEFRLGDRVLVKVAHVDVARRELDFRLVKALGGPADVGGELQHSPQSRRSGPPDRSPAGSPGGSRSRGKSSSESGPSLEGQSRQKKSTSQDQSSRSGQPAKKKSRPPGDSKPKRSR